MKSKLFYIFFLSFSFALSQSKATEIWEPIPQKIESFSFLKAPIDAIILFDGTDFTSYSAKIWKLGEIAPSPPQVPRVLEKKNECKA